MSRGNLCVEPPPGTSPKGVQHCGGGPGADNIGASSASTSTDPGRNARIALENWVENGTAPEALIAAKGDEAGHAPAMTRLLCPYPQSAKYNGRGDPKSANSYACAVAAK
jgi:feruloyl esterase